MYGGAWPSPSGSSPRSGYTSSRNLTSAPFVAAVLHRVFVAGNARVLAQDALVEAVDDHLFELRGGPGADPYPRTALQWKNLQRLERRDLQAIAQQARHLRARFA